MAVGYRVRSSRGTQFRQWVTARLNEYLVKGFTMELAQEKLSPLLKLKYNNAIADAVADLGRPEEIGRI